MPKPAVPKSGGLRSVKEENQHTHDTKKNEKKTTTTTTKNKRRTKGLERSSTKNPGWNSAKSTFFFSLAGLVLFDFFLLSDSSMDGRAKKKKETDKSFDAANLRRRL